MNGIGFDSGNTSVTNGRDIPWLQDAAPWFVWSSWAPTYRDVVILDGANEVYGVYNLTANNLAVAANYDALRQMLLDAAATLPP